MGFQHVDCIDKKTRFKPEFIIVIGFLIFLLIWLSKALW